MHLKSNFVFRRIRSLPTLLVVIALAAAAIKANGRGRENFDFGWRFSRDDQSGADQAAYQDESWRKLDLPHDWSIEGPYDEKAPSGGSGGYLPTGIGWYRKHFQVPASLRGQKLTIQFDGVYSNSDVWLNGQLLGRRPYGYSTFRYDLTPYLNFGEAPNVIAVRVDNSKQPGSRWYSGSGIYRNVWMTIADPLQIAPDGITITTPDVTAESAVVHVRTHVTNGRSTMQKIEVLTEILTTDGQPIAGAPSVVVNQEIAAAGETGAESLLTLPTPALWSPETPNLYRLHSELRVDGKPVDTVDTTCGIRTLTYDVNRGFLLNGHPTKMLGMCLHHDGGAVGAAVPTGVLERRLRLLKEMGCNAIRCSHNPPAPELLDLCDRLGFLVMDEAFDEWTVRKPQVKFGYSDYFDAWYERDLVDFIRRDRNHPSIVMWSAGNEIGEQRAANGSDVLRKLVDVFHREDPTRPVTAAMDNIFTDAGPAPTAFTDVLDVVGYNYVDRWLDRRENFFGPDRSTYPTRRFIGTEDQGVGGVRGHYQFDVVDNGFWKQPPFTAATIRTEQMWKFALTHDYVIGHFMWTGIDYLGEAFWPRKGASSGALDTCGFPKDSYYFYQSIFSEKPMLHLLPHWNWPDREGKITPVLAYTNCDTVELFLNGLSLGKKAREFPRQGTKGGWNHYVKPEVFPTTADLHLSWDVPYSPGVLRAVGYREGKEVCSDEVKTAGPATAVVLSADRAALEADAREVVHLTAKVIDAAGVVVPTADNLITFELDGPAKLLGTDNGDLASHESYQSSARKAFSGQCLAIYQSKRQPGKIRITARADGLKPATVEIEVVAAPEQKPMLVAVP